MIFNKTTEPVYSTVSNLSMGSDGSLSATYIVGFGREDQGELVDFRKLAEQTLWLSVDDAKEIYAQPLSEQDIGKNPFDLILNRVYEFCKKRGDIIL